MLCPGNNLERTVDAKTKRKHLNDYSHAHRDIELTQLAIDLMERVGNSETIVKALKNKRHSHLRKMDAAAAKLGAPYGA